MNRTSISWCDMTSNPIYAVDKETGKRGWYCTKVSPGCAHCYAETLNKRFGNALTFTEGNRSRVEWRFNERELEAILRRRKPARIFMCDMLDLFHEDVPDMFISRVFETMALAKQHTFQILTKRPERMRNWVRRQAVWLESIAATLGRPGIASVAPNVHLGVTVENDRNIWRLDELFKCPAAHYFVSCEPLLGPLKLDCLHRGPGDIWLDALTGEPYGDDAEPRETFVPAAPGGVSYGSYRSAGPRISWVIVGGESGGPPERALVERVSECISYDRMDSPPSRFGYIWKPKSEALGWVRSLRDQCLTAGVPFFFKQWGGPKPTSGGHLLDGREHREMLG